VGTLAKRVGVLSFDSVTCGQTQR